MAVTAYVLIKSNTSEVDRVKTELEEIDGITSADIVAGDVDFIAKITAETPGAVKDIVASGIQTISGVENTQTYIAME